jgi:hypothetical protein
MSPFRHIIPVIIAASASAHAGELTLEMKPFFITHSIPATALPGESTEILLDAEIWTSFEITSIAKHGSIVKKDEPLIVFETEDIDKKLDDTRRAISTEKLELDQTLLDLATLEKTVPEQLIRIKLSAEEAAEELEYFTKTQRKIAEESADFGLKRNRQILASYQEELKQLLQMYEADDITEDTEEIILQKQHDTVEAAEFALRREILNHKRTMEISIPRLAVELTQKRDDTALALEKGNKDLPRSIEMKKIEAAGLRTSLERNQQALTRIESDRKLFEIKAPADGTFYLGTIKDGKWITGDLIKSLSPKGSAPVGKTFATFIPSTANLVVHAFLDQATAGAIRPAAEGTATLGGRGEESIPVILESLSTAPDPDLKYSALFTAKWPDGITPVAGQSLQIKLISYATEKAFTVPSKALEYGPLGWTAEVKLADGKTEKRAVTRGKSSEDQTEITGGLEAGQVVIVPQS